MRSPIEEKKIIRQRGDKVEPLASWLLSQQFLCWETKSIITTESSPLRTANQIMRLLTSENGFSGPIYLYNTMHLSTLHCIMPFMCSPQQVIYVEKMCLWHSGR